MSTHPVTPQQVPSFLPESPLVPNARLRQIYTLMLQCRALHQRIGSLVAEGRVAAELLPPAGEEATLASTAAELRPGDALLCSRRDWLPAMLKGVPLAKITRWLLAGPGSRPRALSDGAYHLEALPSRPDSQLASALETAITHKRKKNSLALAYIGSEVSAAAWQQALEPAARRRLPVLFVCRTSTQQPQPADLLALAHASQTPHIYVDGGDALAVYRVAQEATGRARRKLGPTLIECRLESSPPSTGAGTSSLESDPFAAMERHLAAKGIFSPAWKQEVEAAFTQQLESALLSATGRTASVANR